MNQGVRWHHWSNRAILDKSGCLIKCQLVTQDFTEGVQAEQELRESEAAILELYRVTASQKLEFEERLQRMLEILKSMLVIRTSYQGEPNGTIALHQCDTLRQWTDATGLQYGDYRLKSSSATLGATRLYQLCHTKLQSKKLLNRLMDYGLWSPSIDLLLRQATWYQNLEEMSKGGTTRTALALENQLEAEYERFKLTLQVE
jgi:HPt (histidine-containing phosphotransfer) domain-containing protein